jgi:hypothetical protein
MLVPGEAGLDLLVGLVAWTAPVLQSGGLGPARNLGSFGLPTGTFLKLMSS